MKNREFDKFAEEYAEMLKGSLRASGEAPEYFAEYKVRHVAGVLGMQEMRVGEAMDFGCGIGGSVPYFQRYLPNTHLTCIDVSQKSIDIAQSRFPGAATYQLFDGGMLPFEDNTFDIVFSACVFHHIPATEHIRLLSEIRRVLTQDGILFVFEHNPLNPFTVRVVNRCPFDENAVLISSQQLTRRFTIAQFNSIRCSYQLFFPGFLKAWRRLETSLAWCPLGAQYCLSARK